MSTLTNRKRHLPELWITLADVSPTPACEVFGADIVEGAAVHVVGYASDSSAFEAAVRGWLQAIDLVVNELEDTQRVSDKQQTTGLSAELAELVLHVRETMRMGVGTFYSYGANEE